jgi:thiamine-phosphate pyrophosphorylase
MELIVISNPVTLIDEANLINHLFIAGLKCFHIRKPDDDKKAISDLIGGIAPQFYDRISLHQFHELAADYGIKRLHYTEQNRDATDSKVLAAQRASGYILSTSVHKKPLLPSLAQFHYAFYGPVFNSISKAGYHTALPANFKLDKGKIKLKVIGLGGIDIPRLKEVKAMNFDGAAVLGALWNEPHKAVEYFYQLKENWSHNA